MMNKYSNLEEHLSDCKILCLELKRNFWEEPQLNKINVGSTNTILRALTFALGALSVQSIVGERDFIRDMNFLNLKIQLY